MDDQIGIAIVGCGDWGMNYVRVFSELPQATVIAAIDLREDRLQVVKRRFLTVDTFQEYGEALENPDVEGVVVSTPASMHHSIVRDSLLSGKHVLVEKPMTTHVWQAEELAALAEELAPVLMVGHTFLYNSGIRKMKTCMNEKDFGRIYYLHGLRTNLGPIRKDVNAIWDLAPHDVSIFNYLLDSTPEWASAVGATVLGNGREDVGFITLHYPNGVIGNIHVSWANPNKVRQVTVVASNKRICFDDLNSVEPIRIFEKGVASQPTEANSFGEFRLLVRDGDIVSPRVEASEPLKNQCSHFLDCIRTGKKPVTDARNGLEAVKVMVAIQASMARNGEPANVAQIAAMPERYDAAVGQHRI
jgi:predicted dehydrogenase